MHLEPHDLFVPFHIEGGNVAEGFADEGFPQLLKLLAIDAHCSGSFIRNGPVKKRLLRFFEGNVFTLFPNSSLSLKNCGSFYARDLGGDRTIDFFCLA